MDLYFECNNGISGDMSVAALLDLGADKEKLKTALMSMNLENEFSYEIKNVMINSIKATDFNVILPQIEHHHHHHHHRNLEDVCKIIDKAEIEKEAKTHAKKIFQITAEAEAMVHNTTIEQIHFHEIGAIDSIVDIVSFCVLYQSLSPENVYFSPLTEGKGSVICQHGELSVPVPAVVEIVSKYSIPIKLSDNDGEMITPTGASIVASLYKEEQPKDSFIIEKVGYGAGKRKYKNPILRVMKIRR